MKRNIVVQIEPDADGVWCGECPYLKSYQPFCDPKREHVDLIFGGPQAIPPWKRGPKCLRAERLLRELVEAGEGMRIAEVGSEERWGLTVKNLEGDE